MREPAVRQGIVNPVRNVNEDHGTCSGCGTRLFFAERRRCSVCERRARARGEA